ncbi:hypothetical protein FQN54_005364 [Arachnomyces sp. PD_36]|nr:hypothetical protein FQN54_005364 [Arachnomyces sp. PD_36]
MRFLCLHGMSTNTSVLEFQIQGIRAKLDPSHEYVFLDGHIETDAAPGVGDIFPGPYYGYYTENSREQIEFAYERVINFVESRGPFGGVIGFSQGGALAAAAMLRHAKLNPEAEPLFKLGIFLCCTLPFDLSGPPESEANGCNGSTENPSGAVGNTDLKLKSAKGKQTLQQFNPKTHSERITVPTVHIIGRQDQYLDQCEALADLCCVNGNADGNMTRIYHERGHLVARDPPFVSKAVNVIEDKILGVESPGCG